MTCDDVCGSTYSAMQVLYRCSIMTEKVKSASCRMWPGKEVQPMTQVSDRIAAPRPAGAAVPAGLLARRLAAAGMGVQVTHRAGTCELAITGVTCGRSLVALEPGGQARWYYEPTAGISPLTLAAIIAYLLNAP